MGADRSVWKWSAKWSAPMLYDSISSDTIPTDIYKFADNTTILGWSSNYDETEYNKETGSFVIWCRDNSLSLNVSKMTKLITDFRKCLPQSVSMALKWI